MRYEETNASDVRLERDAGHVDGLVSGGIYSRTHAHTRNCIIHAYMHTYTSMCVCVHMDMHTYLLFYLFMYLIPACELKCIRKTKNKNDGKSEGTKLARNTSGEPEVRGHERTLGAGLRDEMRRRSL